VVTGPLVLLAIPSVVIGAIALMPMLFGDFFKGVIHVDGSKHGAMEELAEQIHGWVPWRCTASRLPVLAGSGRCGGVLCVLHGQARDSCCHHGFLKKIGLYQVLETSTTWTGSTRTSSPAAPCLGTFLWKAGDQAIIDGAIVNGSWKLVAKLGQWVRGLQTGYLYHYALVMMLGIVALMTYFVWLNK
jgi:NADH-quinone oxidoreductase subunit L